MVIKCIAINSHISIAEIVKETGIPIRTVDRLISHLKEDGALERVGSKRIELIKVGCRVKNPLRL